MLNVLAAKLSVGMSALALICLCAIFGLQLRHSRSDAVRAPRWQKVVTLGAQTLLTYLPILLFQAQWGGMAGFLAGSLLLLLPARIAWPSYAAVGLSMLLPPLLNGLSLLDSFYLCQSTLLTGVIVFGLTRLADLVHVLHDTRGRLARMAVTKERLRFARDLHDLLGYSLSAITLKSELIHRLLPGNSQRALTEIREVLAISRQSLADVRTVASGMRDMSLAEEINAAEGLLVAADINTRVTLRQGSMSQQVSTVLAAVLREAITNLLRHSKADSCVIEAVQEGGRVRLVVENNGAQPDYRDPSAHSGSGLGNLTSRMREISGDLRTERGPDDTFRLIAETPAFPERRQSSADAMAPAA
ncbi:sensor histidine kinase [Streptomyces sp. VRA16 Mangrove soil]|uniref:sensor histidine kinase n=1 Tax=Streptomyces sp. VRA16 Mangrove soil TaxID=2817434 RepID=UPI001A9F048A|nr:histidine kinase [Streptomyces sp. VRA16 Mangrove soil]MBO1334102.1 two-component sensor histidine kinase [Streptomyces sp. VRA16 Mangrove soil]